MNHNKNVVVYKNTTLHLNEHLLKKQNISPQKLEEIKEFHIQRLKIEESFLLGQIDAKDYREAWEMNQYYLQDAWGFPQDAKHHRFWDMQGCSCNANENMKRYPNGNYVYSKDCKVHSNI